MKKRLINGIFGAIIALTSLFAFVPAQAAIPRDCDSNAIMRCGAETKAELTQKTTGDITNIYAYYGIKKADFSLLVEGTVYKDGRVTVGNTLVATGAISTGRQVIGSSKAVNAGGVTIYERPTSTSFNSASIPAFIKMTNGTFSYAVIKSCGNPTKATPTPKPPVPPKVMNPSIDIQKDVSKAIVNVGEQFVYTVKVKNIGDETLTNVGVLDKAPANIEFIPGSSNAGSTVTKSEFKAIVPSLAKGATLTYTFKAKFTIYVSSNVVNQACVLAKGSVKTVGDCDTAYNKPKKPPVVPETPKAPETPVALTPVASVTEIPSTGSAEIIGGTMGLSSTAYGIVSFIKSRRNLRNLFSK